MKTDIQIAQEATLKPIKEVATLLGICEDDLELYGKYKAKISEDLMERTKNNPGHLRTDYRRPRKLSEVLYWLCRIFRTEKESNTKRGRFLFTKNISSKDLGNRSCPVFYS